MNHHPDRSRNRLLPVLLASLLPWVAACRRSQESREVTRTPSREEVSTVQQGPVTTPSGLQYEDIQVGGGNSPQKGRQVVVHYTGTLTDGQEFDSSRRRNKPFSFTIGVGQVIPGWDEGVMSMKEGGRRKLTIPSKLGYGSQGVPGVIPANATLVFDVELIEVK